MKIGSITINLTKIKRITKNYCGQLYANKLDNLDEMDKFQEIYTLPKLKKKAENLNRIKTSKRIESIIKILPKKKSPRPNAFLPII